MPKLRFINISFETSPENEQFKIANVMPIYKAGDKRHSNNYRTVSITAYLTKILDKCLVKRMENFIDKNNLLLKKQFGFRRNKSPEDANLH